MKAADKLTLKAVGGAILVGLAGMLAPAMTRGLIAGLAVGLVAFNLAGGSRPLR